MTAAPMAAPAQGTLSPDAEARAREALHQTEAGLDAPKGTAVAATQVKNSAPPAGWHETAPPPAPKTPETAATHAAGSAAISKQARLADLLNKYKMDQITPEQYFQQKAKILAEP
jgi:hypothetical protein